MRYFSGFCLKGEESLFSSYIKKNDFTIVGFSYGTQRAFEHVYNNPQDRVERLILISPAFFQTQKASFVRTQLRYFDQDRDAYIEQFLANVSYPTDLDLLSYLDVGSKDQLNSLLTYRWEREKFEALLGRGIQIEIYIGARDKIINSEDAFSLFSSFATTYLIKDTGHLII